METMSNYLAQCDAMQTFVENVSDLMEKRGVSVSQLARDTGLNRQGLSALLNNRGGNCSIQTASKIAERLEVPLHVLLKPK